MRKYKKEFSKRYKRVTRNNKLSYSERKDRFLVVTTVMAAIVILLQWALKLVQMSMKELYIDKETLLGKFGFPFSGEHILPVLFLSVIIFILGKFAIYCYIECRNFSDKVFSEDNEDKANDKYQEIFDSIYRLILIIFIVIMITVIIFSDSLLQSIMYFVVLLFVLSIIVFTICKSWGRDTCKKWGVSSLIEFGIIFLISTVFIFPMALNAYKIEGYANFEFNNSSLNLSFNGNEIPKDINVCLNEYECDLDLETDFTRTVVSNSIYTNTKNKEEKISTQSYKYNYKSDINLSGKYIEGKNTLCVTFIISNKKYTIMNDVNVDNDTYVYNQNDIEVTY